MHPDDPRRKNLRPKPFPPGVSGNPAGRPPGIKDRGTILRRYLALQYKDKHNASKPQPFGADAETPMTVEEMIELSILRKALSGDVTAYKEIKDTLFGKNPDIVVGDPERPVHTKNETTVKNYTGQELIDELKQRGLPTNILEE